MLSACTVPGEYSEKVTLEKLSESNEARANNSPDWFSYPTRGHAFCILRAETRPCYYLPGATQGSGRMCSHPLHFNLCENPLFHDHALYLIVNNVLCCLSIAEVGSGRVHWSDDKKVFFGRCFYSWRETKYFIYAFKIAVVVARGDLHQRRKTTEACFWIVISCFSLSLFKYVFQTTFHQELHYCLCFKSKCSSLKHKCTRLILLMSKCINIEELSPVQSTAN